MSRNAQYSQVERVRGWQVPGTIFVLFQLLLSLVQADEPHPAVPGLSEARVVIVQDAGATEHFEPVPATVQMLVDKAIKNLTHQANIRAAWTNFVSPKDVVGIKVLSAAGQNSGTRRDVVEAVVKDLLAVGLPPTNIVVWDRRSIDLRLAGFFELERQYGIRVQGSIDSGYDEKVFYETPLLGQLTYTDSEFGKKGLGLGRKSYMTKLVTQELTKIINITPMLHHNAVGVSGNLFSLALGSVDNVGRFEGSAQDLARAIPEIWALSITRDDVRLSDRVVLNIVDALICQYEGQQQSLLHYSTVLNQLRFSKDPVALDVLSLQEIRRERELAGVPIVQTNLELYANATLLEIGVSETNRIRVEKIP